MVNRVHAGVRGPGYSAHDRDLQLWVAATLAHNGIFIQERVHGPMSSAAKERLYRQSWVFGTALQVREEDWPATYADFETYWEETLSTRLGSVPLVRDYARALLSTRGVPLPLRPAVRVQSLLARGNVSPRVREVLGLGWSPREQRRYDRLWRVHDAVYPRLPALVRAAPARLVLRDFRRRLRTGRRVI
jgi:uncharacterized protein (DUF2236 family)